MEASQSSQSACRHRQRKAYYLVCVHVPAGEQSTQQKSSRTAAATGVAAGGVSAAGGTQLPLARVKLIIKTDPDTSLASQEAVLLVTKVTTTACVCCV